ncbi:serine carboxypeptidase-like 2 isoform X2 [Euphorbia lathyris]|uniref:serine carboxypeptidase-like 2 isoform X2 n=1 Tax=Euphorbia lathyris TaxID=212925 RepID=UPI0033142C0F
MVRFWLSALLILLLQFADSYTTVKYLPGFEGPLPFQLETGYIGVDKSEDVQLFYYFVKSQRNPKKDPLLLWLTGGPGCSALSALLYEIGPISFEVVEYNGSLPKLILNPHTWTQVASIIFIDIPVGTGFSYATNSFASLSTDLLQVQQAYQFFTKWLRGHPEFVTNPVYIAGDSYSGITLPAIVHRIIKGNEQRMEPLINLKGYIIGNPVTDINFDGNAQIPFAHGMGLISDELYQSLKITCEEDYVNIDPTNAKCLKDMQEFNKIYGYVLSYIWADDKSVRHALGIREQSRKQWLRCNYGLPYMFDIPSSIKYHAYLGNKGYRSLIYSGDHDIVVPFLGTQGWIRSLNYSILDDWRPWVVEGQIAGYTRSYSNRMTFATVKGGGHTAPEYKPRECFAMFKRWIDQDPL